MPPLVSCAGPGQGQPCPAKRLIPQGREPHKAHRCSSCAAVAQAWKKQARGTTTNAYTRWIRQQRARWITTRGYVCNGGHPSNMAPHPCNPGDLTMHHPYAVGAGGPALGPVIGMCRKGNSELGATRPGSTTGQGHRQPSPSYQASTQATTP